MSRSPWSFSGRLGMPRDRVRATAGVGRGLRREVPYLAGGPARTWHLAESSVGCRGFNGPVPQPTLDKSSSVVGRMLRLAEPAVNGATETRCPTRPATVRPPRVEGGMRVVQAQPDADAIAEAYLAIEPRLASALEANRPDSTTDHVSIALPSYSVSETILSHYGDRIPSLEHRYLASVLMPARIPAVNIVYLSTRRPEQAAIDYYPALLSPERRARTVGHYRLIEWNDGTPRSVAARFVSRPDLVEELRTHIGGRPALIEPWNVTEHETALAVVLGVPINGTRPELRDIGFKGAGRRLFVEAGVPTPIGREDVRTTDDVIAAILAIRAERPDVSAVVIKHDDSGAGDGNAVIDLSPIADADDPVAWLRERIDGLPEWYRADLLAGGIVEERITGARFTSPSAQADILPSGEIRVLATHEQVLGGADDQVYLGCRFPADPAYASVLASHARAIGEQLAARGALGRFGV